MDIGTNDLATGYKMRDIVQAIFNFYSNLSCQASYYLLMLKKRTWVKEFDNVSI